jgi:hypothetical protein
MTDTAPEYRRLRLRVECIIDVSPDKVGDPAALLRNGMHRGLSRFSDAAWGIGALVSRHVMDDAEWTKGEIAQQEADRRDGARAAIVELSALWKAANGIHDSGHCSGCAACQANRELHERLG